MDFHYNIIQKEFPGKHSLLYQDTDSFFYEIIHPDLYEWIGKNKTYFDLSKSSREDLKDDENIMVLGKFKDEMNSLVIKEYIALNPKVYSVNHLEKNEIINKKVLKGVSKAVVKNEITYNDYVNVLEKMKLLKKM